MQPFDRAATLPEALRYHRALESVPNRSGGIFLHSTRRKERS